MKRFFYQDKGGLVFLCAHRDKSPSKDSVTLFGCPMDVTCSYRSGTGNAPNEIRRSSDSIETYSPFLNMDLVDLDLIDVGDITFDSKSPENWIEHISTVVGKTLETRSKFLCLGGEHTISIGIAKALLEIYPDLVFIQADAHADLRDSYGGLSVNHASVMKRITDLIGPDRIYQFGIRSGERSEFQWARNNNTLYELTAQDMSWISADIGGKPVYLSVDIDVMDPSCVPGVGNPEPGGWFYKDMERFLMFLKDLNLISADLVELNPALDKSEVSSITTAKIARELLLILGDTPIK